LDLAHSVSSASTNVDNYLTRIKAHTNLLLLVLHLLNLKPNPVLLIYIIHMSMYILSSYYYIISSLQFREFLPSCAVRSIRYFLSAIFFHLSLRLASCFDVLFSFLSSFRSNLVVFVISSQPSLVLILILLFLHNMMIGAIAAPMQTQKWKKARKRKRSETVNDGLFIISLDISNLCAKQQMTVSSSPSSSFPFSYKQIYFILLVIIACYFLLYRSSSSSSSSSSFSLSSDSLRHVHSSLHECQLWVNSTIPDIIQQRDHALQTVKQMKA